MTSPETRSPSPSTPETAKEDHELFGVENFDEIREEQRKILEAELDKVDDPYDTAAKEAAKAAAYAKFEAHAKKYLIDHASVTDDDDPELVRKRVGYVRHFSIDNVSEDDWLYDKVEDDGTLRPSGRKLVVEDYKARDGETKAEPVPIDEPETLKPDEAEKDEKEKTDEEKKDLVKERLEKIEALERELKNSQKAKHLAFAARMAVGFFARQDRKQLQGEYDKAEKVYLEKLEALELLRLEQMDSELRGESYVPTSMEYKKELEKRTSDRKKEDYEGQRAAMLEQGGLKAKLLEKYANMSTKKKIALGVLAGGLLAAGGFGAALLGGVAGGVFAVVGGGAVAGGKGARTYATLYSRIYADKDPKRLEFNLEDDDSIDSHEALKRALNDLHEESTKEIESADKMKKRAVLFGLGAAALGSGAALGASHAFDWVSDRPSGIFGGVIGDQFAGPEVAPEPPLDADHTWALDSAQPTPEVMHFNPEAYTINPGDGGYDMFNHIDGISQDHWPQLWQSVGPDLQNVPMSNGVPFSYQMPNGEWGIHMTPDGKVPQAALDMIADKHQELFGTNPALPSGGVTEAISQNHPIPTTIDHPVINSQDVASFKDILSQPTIDPSKISAHPELFDKLSYVAPNLELHRYATEALGIPERVWTESVQPFVSSQLEARNPDFMSAFYESPQGLRFTGNGKLSPDVLASLFQSVPGNVRGSFGLAG